MGCGESKHAVNTANTITRKKTTGKDVDIGRDQTRKNGDKTNVQQKSPNENNAGYGNAEVKDITENKEFKDEQAGRSISKDSPNRFFSSRKDEDVEGEGKSEKSDYYYSPRVIESGKETSFNGENDKLVGGQTKQESEKDEAVTVKEETKTGTRGEETEVAANPASKEKQISGEEALDDKATERKI